MAKKATSKPADPPLPGQLDMFDNQTDDDLIAENFRLEDLIKAAQAKFDEWAKPHKERIAAIENAIRSRLLQRNADSTKTDSGTAYFSDIMNTKIENTALLLDFINENWPEIGADVKLNLPIGTVRQHMDNNNGQLPPGMTHSFWKRLNIKRS
jgi:acyl-CoA reductase-like NAD-dependent aldehyde dehydrogenase